MLPSASSSLQSRTSPAAVPNIRSTRLRRRRPSIEGTGWNASRPTPTIRDVLVVLTLSGGGTRAASLAYGTMEALRDVKLRIGGRTRTLLDEVDIIKAVSGGSVVAAYYALHRERLFEDFETKFLKRDVEAELRTALVANLGRLARRPARRIFRSRAVQPRDVCGPRAGEHASVRGDQRLGALDRRALSVHAGPVRRVVLDLGSVPIARAVAASAAPPSFFSAITLRSAPAARNHAPHRRHRQFLPRCPAVGKCEATWTLRSDPTSSWSTEG